MSDIGPAGQRVAIPRSKALNLPILSGCSARVLYLHVVEGLQFTTHVVNFVIVHLLYFSQSLAHLVLPELAILRSGIAIDQRCQLLHLLHALKKDFL